MELTKFTLFVGLNDKESKQQEISTIDAYKVVSNLITSNFEGGTISEAMCAAKRAWVTALHNRHGITLK